MPKDNSKNSRQDASASAAKDDQDAKDKPKKILRACDACHHRRVRCNHNNPCDNCIRLNINCTWVKASKGKQASGRRIDLLRKGHNPAAAEFTPSPSRPPTDHSPITAPSPSASRAVLPPQQAHSPRHYQPPLASSAMSPPGIPASATSPSSLYSRDAPPNYHRNSYGGGGYSRYDANSAAGPSGPAQHPSPGSHWSSPSSRSPGHRYSHGGYPSQDYPPPHMSGSSWPHHHHHSSYSHHSPSSSYSQHPQYSQPPPHHAPPAAASQRHTSNAGLGANAPAAASQSGFPPSQAFSEGLGGSFSELAPDVAASLRLPDFGTSLADSYLNPQEGESRVNVLLEMNSGGVPPDAPAHPNAGNGAHTDSYSNNTHDPFANGRQTFLDVLGQSSQLFGAPGSTPGSATYSDTHPAGSNEPHPLSDSVLIPCIKIFFDRLQSIMPVFTDSWIYGKIDRGEHRSDPQLGAMLIALSAFALCQPVDSADHVDSSSRKSKVRWLLEESVRMRNSALLGSNPSLEAIMCSFFIFGALFGLGEENAAWFRLREAVTLGYLLRIHETSSYESLKKDEQERRLRAYLLLAITERAFAIQSGSSITFRGNPRKATDAIRRKFDVSQLQDFPNLQSRLFDVVDEKFVDCWNRKCPGPGCDYLDAKRALQLHRAIKESDEDEQAEKEAFRASKSGGGGVGERGRGREGSLRHHPYNHYGGGGTSGAEATQAGGGGGKADWDRDMKQKADVEVTRQWLLNRLWMICRSHGLLSADAEEKPLRIDYSIDIARETLRVCSSLSLRSMEAHGIGLTRKLNDIAQTLVIVCRDYPAVAMSVPFESDPIHVDPSQFGPHFDPSPAAHQSPHSASDANPGTVGDHPSTNSAGTGLGEKPLWTAYAIEAILHKYLEIFKRFRAGDHPYLPLLVEALGELPKINELGFDMLWKELGLGPFPQMLT